MLVMCKVDYYLLKNPPKKPYIPLIRKKVLRFFWVFLSNW